MLTQFTASQMIELRVTEAPLPIEAYLADPARLVYALVEPDRVSCLPNGQFRVVVRSLSFLGLSLEAIVTLAIRFDGEAVQLRSVACEIRGIEFVNHRFELNLDGQLAVLRSRQSVKLWGKADLQVRVDVPPPFSLTPPPILEMTGNALLKNVLATIQQRIKRQLLLDYQNWARERVNLPVA
jgi:hypothetical protein